MRKISRIHTSCFRNRTATLLSGLVCLYSHTALSLPQGGVVSAGSAGMVQGDGLLSVTQGTDRAVINWNSFNIAPGERVRFQQPSAASAILNRIHDRNPSTILGSIVANGNILLSNPNGMLFGAGASVDVGGLVASSANISNADFMSGNFSFTQPGDADAAIRNAGSISAHEGGLVALVAPEVQNSGLIVARGGRVQLGAGETFAVDLYGDGLLSLDAGEEITRKVVDNTGTIRADGGHIVLSTADAGGMLDGLINHTGVIEANTVGFHEGTIELHARAIAQQGSIRANGGNGRRGGLILAAFERYIDSERALMSAKGGGSILLAGMGEESRLFASGKYDATGGVYQRGGTITASAQDVKLYAADLDASGDLGGGVIRVGGDARGNPLTPHASSVASGSLSAAPPQGGSSLPNARTVTVNPTASIRVDAERSGKGGDIVVWSDRETVFAGEASARGGDYGGNGGSIEISSKGEAKVGGTVSAASPTGQAGTLLLDPENITIANGGLTGTYLFELIDPNAAVGNSFGSTMIVLSNGNIVVTSPSDDFAAADAGAVYLFNGATGGVISTIRGSTASDQIGNFGATAVAGNGNYVIRSPNWNNGAVVDAGAATWGSGITGVSGVISAANSLVGSTASDQVGSSITSLSSGNYLVPNSNWDNGAVANVGAVTWSSGAAGVTGVVSAANSLVGSTANDQVGVSLTTLSNGNYLVRSASWDNGAVANAGAVTWGSSATGVTGAVSAANSLVGSTASDGVGSSVTILGNGNYAVNTTNWDNGAVANAGAVTWGNGLGGTVGAVSAANSLVGSTASDQVGSGGIYVLGNDNYVVSVPLWNNGATADAGAVTWGNGLGGTVGAVSAANSLVGSRASDQIGNGGGISVLSNGNYVVRSTSWDNGAIVNAGAVTWGNGLGGTVGAVSAANSLVGSTASDSVGNGVTILSNGNYVVRSSNWDNGATVNVGAATWGNGLGGTVGAVSAANSLVGSTASDQVGASGISALTNGNYVVLSNNWDNGAVVNAGAATWGNGLGGTVGAVSAANSLVGSTASDYLSVSITTLNNGNYVIRNSNWDNGAIVDAGAVTWGNGLGGTVGAISAANSLIGSTASDFLGVGSISTLSNGNYVVNSGNWDNGAIVDAGAVTWGNGLGGTVGAVSAANSLVGSTAGDFLGDVTVLSNGNYVVSSTNWNNGAIVDAGVVTWGNGLGGTVGTASSANSLVGSIASDLVGIGGVLELSSGDYVVRSTFWDNGAIIDAGALTWGDGTAGIAGTINAGNSILGPSANASPQVILEDAVAGRFISGSLTAEKIYVSESDGPAAARAAGYSFAAATGQDITLAPSFLTNTLDAGTNVALQASNDITVDNAITVNNGGGDGGDLTLQAGRSILINANITTDNGDLNLFANEDLAAGVVDGDRAAGNAVITAANGVTISTGTGVLNVRLDDGAGKTNAGAGDISFDVLNVGSFTVDQRNAADVLFNDTVSYTGASTVTTAAGGDVTFASTLNGGGTLGITSQDITFGDDAGAVTRLGAVTLTNPRDVTANGTFRAASVTQTGGTGAINFTDAFDATGAFNLTTAGNITFGGDVVYVADSELDAGAGDVLYSGTLNGAGALEVTTTGDITFTGNVGGVTRLGDVLLDPRHTIAGSFLADNFTLVGGTGNVTFGGTGLDVVGAVDITTNGNITGTYLGNAGALDAGAGTITAAVSFNTLDLDGAGATMTGGYIGAPGAASQAMANLISIGGLFWPVGIPSALWTFEGYRIGQVAAPVLVSGLPPEIPVVDVPVAPPPVSGGGVSLPPPTPMASGGDNRNQLFYDPTRFTGSAIAEPKVAERLVTFSRELLIELGCSILDAQACRPLYSVGSIEEQSDW